MEPINAAQVEGFANAFGLRLYNEPNDPMKPDCWQANSKWMLAPACPTFADPVVQAKVKCYPILGLTTPAAVAAFQATHHLQGMPTIANLDQTLPWVLIEAPVMVDCAAATQWTVSRCIDPTVATPDIKGRYGNENDWMQFFWGLTASSLTANPNVPDVWTMTDALRPYQQICDGTPAKGICHVEMTWGVLTGAVNSLGANQTLSAEQIQRFTSLGDSRGVD